VYNLTHINTLSTRTLFSLEWLHNPTPLKKHVHVTIGLVLELRRVRMCHNLNLKKASLWIKYLCELDYTLDADGVSLSGTTFILLTSLLVSTLLSTRLQETVSLSGTTFILLTSLLVSTLLST
jgi:hypothetical protein